LFFLLIFKNNFNGFWNFDHGIPTWVASSPKKRGPTPHQRERERERERNKGGRGKEEGSLY
jgi:hypothetical protein